MKQIVFISILLIQFCINFNSSQSQNKLAPGFDPAEYKQLLEITSRQADTSKYEPSLPYPENCRLEYRSDTIGLNNRWDLWTRNDSVGIISIRGTVPKANSWAEDFYAAMVPAKGSIIINKDYVFIYKLAEDHRAAVHAGWLIGLAYLSPSIIEKINEYYSRGIKNYIIIGHSQGGAIAYLLNSYLRYSDNERVPSDINFKTYCSAPPKPGNLFYSYDFDFINRGGWAMRVYNSEDWVPQTPLSVQALKDFTHINPYTERDSLLVKMSWIERIVFNYITNRLKNTLNDSKDLLNNDFGSMIYKNSIKKFLPEFPEPEYTNDEYYYPCGMPVVLMATPDYQEFIKTETGIPLLFKNHMVDPYYFLLNKIYFDK